MRKILLILSVFAFTLGSCACQGEKFPRKAPKADPEQSDDTDSGESGDTGDTGDTGNNGDSGTPSSPTIPNKPEDAGDRVPLSASITGVQPMTGIVLWNTSSARTKSYVQLEFSYMLYSDVCKEKDVFDWGVMDRLLADVSSRGHQAVVRFRYTYPGKSCAGL